MLGVKNIDLETLQRRLRGLARRYNTLVERISETELLADAIQLELEELSGNYELNSKAASPSGESTSNPVRRRLKTGSTRQDARDALRRTAETGALTLTIKSRSDGASDVRIDEGHIFSLPPLLADLLAVLALDNRITDDQFVGWKTLTEIAILLKKRSGKAHTLHAVTQSIYRLRNRLYHRGNVNPFLVQTNPRRGARFALKRRSLAVGTTSPGQHEAGARQNERRDEWHTSG
jgi:hypothetical protein